VIKAEHDLPVIEGGRGYRVGEGEQEGKMTQTIYAHVSKRIKKSKKKRQRGVEQN
jgi:hypothetical protein